MKLLPAARRSLLSVLALGVAALGPARANPTIVVDATSGEVLYKDMATAPWFPASTTKLMTVYVALSKVREGKISLDTPLRVSAYAASMIPSKMGLPPGHAGDARQRPEDVDGEVAERHRRHHRGRHLGVGAGLRRRDERLRGQDRPARIPFRQSERAARPEPLVLGPRHGDDRPGADHAVSRGARPLQHRRAAVRRQAHPQPQRSARALRRRRRHEDRLHLRGAATTWWKAPPAATAACSS